MTTQSSDARSYDKLSRQTIFGTNPKSSNLQLPKYINWDEVEFPPILTLQKNYKSSSTLITNISSIFKNLTGDIKIVFDRRHQSTSSIPSSSFNPKFIYSQSERFSSNTPHQYIFFKV